MQKIRRILRAIFPPPRHAFDWFQTAPLVLFLLAAVLLLAWENLANDLFDADTGVDTFPHAADIDGDVWEHYGISSQPAFVFINDDGTFDTRLGSLGEDGLTERVEQLLAS